MARPKREDGRNAKTIASNKYQIANYDRINLLVEKGYKEEIKQAAIKCGQSVNAYINSAIAEKMEREK